jgi:hypothetical protein
MCCWMMSVDYLVFTGQCFCHVLSFVCTISDLQTVVIHLGVICVFSILRVWVKIHARAFHLGSTANPIVWHISGSFGNAPISSSLLGIVSMNALPVCDSSWKPVSAGRWRA